MSIGIRGYTIGYDYYAPERSVCFHHYAVGNNARKRNKVHHFWENDNKYAGTGKVSMKRLLGIVHMNPEVPPEEWDHTGEDVYGVGGVRTPVRTRTGLDLEKKWIRCFHFLLSILRCSCMLTSRVSFTSFPSCSRKNSMRPLALTW